MFCPHAHLKKIPKSALNIDYSKLSMLTFEVSIEPQKRKMHIVGIGSDFEFF